MIATAVSKILSTMGAINRGSKTGFLMVIKEFPSRVKRRCPAIIFAVSRTHNVIGRIIFLVSSIKTINIIKAPGVP